MTLLANRRSLVYSFISASAMELWNKSGSLLGFLGLCLFFFLLLQLFEAMGKRLPIRILFLFFMSFQLLFTSYLAYFVYPEYQAYRMVVEPARYFGYVLPAILSFGLGLYWKERRNQSLEMIDINSIRSFSLANPGIAYFFITIGVMAGFAGVIFNGAGVAFVLYVLALLKFVGLFLVILGNIQLNRTLTIIIYASIIISSFQQAMFHDLIIWSIFLFAVMALRYNPKFKVKFLVFVGGILLIVFIQVIKGTYRQDLQEGSDVSIETVINSTEKVKHEEGGLFSLNSIAPQVSRFNQGWIVASILDHVPNEEPFAEGATIIEYLKAAFLPRVLAPNKLKAGDREIFMRYTGRILQEGTSMALSSVGDAYLNYGEIGGWLFLFFYGFLISQLMNFMSKKVRDYPFLPLFALVIFAYAVRIECETQTVMGHIVKSSIILWTIFTVYQRMLRRYFNPSKKTNKPADPVHDLHTV